ncbi:MAG: prepilin peptidase [Terrimicrobiaceae bacterium]|nr:prepilin peptidase [Terrimicrobiaceae bacterium]
MTPPGVHAVFAFLFGAVVGSFLNACIHRLPRGISLDNPRRSFCPHCKAAIPWHRNLPIISWLLLRGRCGSCGAPISPRYLLVEILTGAAFLALWLKFGLPLAPIYALFAALLITATFIDFEHYIIPDRITLGGTAAGIALSAALPALMGVASHWQAALLSVAGAVLGAGLLWLVVEAGKLAFGRKRIAPPEPQPFRFEPDPENPRLVIGEESWPWQEIFSRESDALLIECEHAVLNGAAVRDGTVRVYFNRMVADARETPIEEVREFTGVLRAVVIPREAMGLGDVKFLACIGAFLGWQAVLFTVATSSVAGALIGGGTMLLTRGRAGGRIPYGPYLALGAALWLVCGPEAIRWYLALLRPIAP